MVSQAVSAGARASLTVLSVGRMFRPDTDRDNGALRSRRKRGARLLFRRCLDGPVSGVAADTSAGAMALNVPVEWGKLLWQLTLERDC